MMTRKEALAVSATTYTTGKPCKYGHLSYRYTQSGACAMCVSESAAISRELLNKQRREYRQQTVAAKTAQLQPLIEARQARAAALKELEPIKLLIQPQDIATVFDTAVELCIAAYPVLERADVQPSRTPLKGWPLYRVHVPPDQVELMRQIANELWNAHGPDLSHVADRVAAQVEDQANKEASDPPEGWK